MGDGLSGAVGFFCVDVADESGCFPRCLRDRQWQWQRTFPLMATLMQTGGSREETAAAAVTVTDVGDGVGGGANGLFCVDAGDEAGCLPDQNKQNNVL